MSDQTVAPAAGGSSAGAAVLAAGRQPKRKAQREPGQAPWLALIFIAPAAILLIALLLYPLVWSAVRSMFTDGPAGGVGSFVWFRNYGHIFTDSATLRAVKNNLYWVLAAPTVITIFGLIFAVLSERVRWGTAFKLVLFMPMAISFVASGVTFALIYADQPSKGLGNAIATSIHDTFSESGTYQGVHPRLGGTGITGDAAKGYTTTKTYAPGEVALLPMTGINIVKPPAGLQSAAAPTPGQSLSGVVWNDFRKGGGGTVGQVDANELGLKGMKVQAVQNGKVKATATADAQGQFTFSNLKSGSYQVRLAAVNFKPPYNGISWLGDNWITWSMMIAYLWIYAGFAMVLLAAGMSAIPRDALEAARIDGATEWQVFRRVTAPLLAPVLTVVFVTLVINVLKVFDLVFIIGGGDPNANVLALQMWTKSFGGGNDPGSGSAIAVLLFLLVLPAMLFNIRRLRQERK